jgi:hypothetical protein
MNQDDLLYRMLTDASEDCTPFWGFVWEVAGDGDDASADARARYRTAIPEAQQLMQKLLLCDLVSVCRGLDNSGLGAEGESELTAEEAFAAVAEAENWRHHRDEDRMGVYFCFYATVAGRRLWHQGRSHFHLIDEAREPLVSEVGPPV